MQQPDKKNAISKQSGFQKPFRSIRQRMLWAFVLLVLLPTTATIVGSIVMGINSSKQLAIEQLESVAVLKENQINYWLMRLEDNLALILFDEQTNRSARTLLSQVAQGQADRTVAKRYLYERFRANLSTSTIFNELFLISRAGTMVLTTAPQKVLESEGLQSYFWKGAGETRFVLHTNSLLLLQPVKDEKGETAGVLCGRVSLDKLIEIMLEKHGLGETGETYLVDLDHVLITPSRFEKYRQGEVHVFTHGADTALKNKVNAHGLYDDYRGVPIVGAYRWLPELQVVLLAERDQAEVFNSTYKGIGINLVIACVALIIAVIASFLYSRSIADPIIELADTATRIAGGDLQLTAGVARVDEIGVLTNAFSNMQQQVKLRKAELEELVKKRTAELSKANEQAEASRIFAEEANASKSDFLARMSHEIRTPLNAVTGLTNIVLKSDLKAEQRDYLNKVQIASNNLLEVINDILDFSKVEAGRLDLEHVPFDLGQIMKQLADLFSDQIAKKNLKLIFDINPNVPIQLTGDSARLAQVLTNLIQNAIKFTQSGEIIVGVDLNDEAPIEKFKATLKFWVSDTGIGITTDELPTLFEPFTQADSYLTRKHEGTGLGLAICQRLVELMGGRIWAESTSGQGCIFSFTVILETRREPPVAVDPCIAQEPVALPSQLLTGHRVLVVEDSELNRDVVVAILEEVGMMVETAENGRIAVDKVTELPKDYYDAVLMDIQMPVLDGYEATRKIREFEKQQDTTSEQPETKTPIIALTAHALKGEKEKCLSADMDDYLSKPIDERDLHRVLVKWICSQ